ncbi:MAG: phytoene synthase [Candidatus Pelagibacter sp. TMED64]|nr:phytoene synthase [Candidatus Pelagibacter sp.]OUU64125.1 MAG: phytoene synthase [Candidatus Pelagibacter sp. TMED64]|tara:strand:- start:14365 stop:15213 length:849 start_codon:yes stop_codon:yes gene_type:complete
MSKDYLSKYAKSFKWAGFFLPKKTYQSCSILYDFCRTMDNIADQELELIIRIKQFKEFKDNFTNKNFTNQIIKNIYKLIDDFKISKKIIYDLFDGIESDLKKEVKINSKKELLIYSYRVAGTVGLMMAKILNVKKETSLKAAIDLGIAMQLTNIARDVVEDEMKNRKYIESNFESIKNTLIIADDFYKSSFSSIGDIPINYRFAILVARRVYREIGNNILKKRNIENYNKSGKIYVSNLGKFFQTILSIFDFFILLVMKSSVHNKKADHQIINEVINLHERI